MNGPSARLGDLARRGRLPHGLLLSGPDEGGLLSAAEKLARRMICGDEPPRRPCDACPACRKALSGDHPDLRTIGPEKQELTIGETRDLTAWLYRGPFEASVKVAIVRNAEALNAAASNSLLKTLEEPPAHGYVFLLTTAPAALLPTVLSRLVEVRFPPQADDPLDAGEAPPWLPDLATLFDGPATASAIFAFTEVAAKDRERLPFLFREVERQIRDRMLELTRRDPGSAELARLDRLYDQTRRAEADLLRRYGNAALALDHLLLRARSGGTG